ncbi:MULTISPECIES: L-2-amino-thiazoline-4-carboxylic acid hydrolase [unclassified Clostridioides]|uniref:L-2-amino-thiazoline-4-carboxylic acid hydrolase n=1 Tax=unclassified Clostridioides TaxID=2635829 RepID=UPI001D0C1A5E|nr:hypothetical protein [Clostridioides sp. ES-S-0001-02]MCC0639505.1 hypothetical protein [Clostridioides sp. ES-S-0049-03]MCC0651452.1 hypothetical protein [Clostridioides sp. ES-S-0001-03]MCC0655766.1 hypothetical protein [Clostridioides sp. ES-S-0123-01]MCC0676569.1 hypothetical protein [Clostridioides sp. ES-W-0018-02]MCC0680554.1 hypothetical protein [Clostridioides sp. ES-S-0005-03]MCC0706212.1 hypothetical protein [Clostridioides sp. ES-S-0190-01]MCC0711230.1 hypothetical protein [Cl
MIFLNKDTVTNETIDKDYAIEEVRMACKHFGDLYFYFTKVLVEEFGNEKTAEILKKVLFERSEERAISMRERANENGDELIADNIASITDVPFLGWVPEFEELHCPYGASWLSRFEENPWFKQFASLYCDVTDTTVAEVFTGDTSHKITKNILWGDKVCERIYFHDDNISQGKYTYGTRNCK